MRMLQTVLSAPVRGATVPQGPPRRAVLLSSTRRPRSGRRAVLISASKPGSANNNANEGFGLLKWAGGVVPQGTVVKGVKMGWKLTWETMMRELAPQSKDGEYTRPAYSFGGRVSSAPGAQFPVESGRYAVYLGNACPWCHRVFLAIALRGLGPHVRVIHAVDDAERASRGGWVFDTPEPVFGASDLRMVYDAAQPGYTGRCTAPCLIDTTSRKIVSNESSDIMRMMNDMHFEGCTDAELLPSTLLPQIDELNGKTYQDINNGVYRSGFATTQRAYDQAQYGLYSMLDEIEERLGGSRFLLGDRLTEADLRLFPTIVRFDAAYATLFKCSKRRIADYPNLNAWMRDIWNLRIPDQSLQVSDTFNVDDARRSYFGQLFPLNPGGIIPSGPTAADLGLSRPAERGSNSFNDIVHHRTQTPPRETVPL
mmetsp:Transcript_26569/g.47276  ORF Transcript_26569/g.47276 Transcript_26569/m.47276 type:complete len:425 (-) Transcript_26569:159-1433(-)